MKKFLTLGLGFTLIAGALIPFTNASREAYHNYMYKRAQERLEYRRFSERQGSTRQLLQPRRTLTEDRKMRGISPAKNLRYPAHGKRNLYSSKSNTANRDLPFRPVSDGIGVSIKQEYHFEPTVDPLDYGPYNMETYENELFSVQILDRWVPTHEKGYFSLETENPYFSLEIKHFEKVCEGTPFLNCVRALSKDQNYYTASSKIMTMSRIHRRAGMTDKVLNDPIHQTQVYTESFVGLVEGKEMYISRYFVEGLNEEIFMLETVSDYRNAKRSVAITKEIFDSFRLYSMDRR